MKLAQYEIEFDNLLRFFSVSNLQSIVRNRRAKFRGSYIENSAFLIARSSRIAFI